MNRVTATPAVFFCHVPHTRGDEPEIVNVVVASTVKSHSGLCSE
jgi:hypothetical protein